MISWRKLRQFFQPYRSEEPVRRIFHPIQLTFSQEQCGNPEFMQKVADILGRPVEVGGVEYTPRFVTLIGGHRAGLIQRKVEELRAEGLDPVLLRAGMQEVESVPPLHGIGSKIHRGIEHERV